MTITTIIIIIWLVVVTIITIWNFLISIGATIAITKLEKQIEDHANFIDCQTYVILKKLKVSIKQYEKYIAEYRSLQNVETKELKDKHGDSYVEFKE